MPSVTVVVDGHGEFPLEWDLDKKTLADVREWLLEKVEIPGEHQIVKFRGGIIRDDDQTLRDHRLMEGCLLHVEDARNDVLPVNIERLAGGEPLSLTMSRRDDTIASLKRKIEEVEGIPLNKIVIRSNGMGSPDANFLSRYYQDGSVDLQLEVRIDIRLNVYTGESILVNVASHDLISAVQHQVQQRLRVPNYHQEMVYNELVMEPDTKLSDHGVTDGANVQVRLRLYEMTIFLKTLLGQTIVISVTSHDTVYDVKRKVMLKEGIPIDRQRIVFTGIQLHNHERFLSYRIEHESAVHIVLRYGDSFEVAVTTPAGRMRSVEVAPKEIVGYIKRKMLEYEGIAVDLQRLYYNNQLLDNDEATMEDCGIVSDARIELRIDGARNTQVFISFRDRQTISIWVDREFTVSQLKRVVAARTKLPEEDMEIYFTRVKLENDRTLSSYVIESNHMLHVEMVPPPVINLIISVQNDPSCEDFQTNQPNNLVVEDLKRAILKRKRYPLSTQQIFFKGHELGDQERLKDCGITSGSKLDVILTSDDLTEPAQNTMHLFVKTLTGKTVTIETQLGGTVQSLKEKIFEKEGLDIESQCLVLAGRQMDDSETVGSVGIQNQSVIHLVLRVPSKDGSTLTIKDTSSASERQFNVVADLDGTVADLKRRIERNENIPIASQRIAYEGRILVDEETLASQDITDGLTLDLIRL